MKQIKDKLKEIVLAKYQPRQVGSKKEPAKIHVNGKLQKKPNRKVQISNRAVMDFKRLLKENPEG